MCSNTTCYLLHSGGKVASIQVAKCSLFFVYIFLAHKITFHLKGLLVVQLKKILLEGLAGGE